MGILSRSPAAVLAWLAGAALLLISEAAGAQHSQADSKVAAIPSTVRLDRLVSACRKAAERRAALAKQLHPLRWDDTTRPDVTRAKRGPRSIAQTISIKGWARDGDGWIPIIAQCQFDDRNRPVVSLNPVAIPGTALDFSEIAPLPETPAHQATLPRISPPQTDSPATSGSALAPTMGKTTEDPKNEDFLHNHWFGLELQGQF
jgi:hypothetical protein